MKEIPFLSVQDVNEIGDYERFFHSKAYLQQKSGDLDYYKNRTKEIMELAEQSGYKKFNKFVQHRKEWHEFGRKIPLAYLDAIGINLNALRYTVELDKKDFKKVQELPLFPEYYMTKMAPLMISKSFPPGLSEEEAIQYLKDCDIKKECFILFPDIKMIIVKPDGNVRAIEYEPGIKVTKEYLVPTCSGRGVGKVYLK